MASITKKLRISEILTIGAGLRSLDGKDVVIEDGDSKSVSKEYYSFDFGTKLLFAKNLTEIDVVAKVYQKEKDQLIERLTGGKKTAINAKKDPELWDQFQLEHKKIFEHEHQISFEMIPMSAFEKQDIPVTVLTSILPVIDMNARKSSKKADNDNGE
jgi:hypothetical protein